MKIIKNRSDYKKFRLNKKQKKFLVRMFRADAHHAESTHGMKVDVDTVAKLVKMRFSV